MAEPLKNSFDAAVVRSLAADLSRAWPAFDARGFVRASLRGLDDLELLARGAHVADAMRAFLPPHPPEALAILERSLGALHASTESFGMTPFRYQPHASFVARFGLEHFEESMRFQHALTQRFTAEGSIRPFLERYPERTLARLRVWATDPSAHVRRLVSEGTRPRLPWAPRVRALLRDPAPVLVLLELLKDDPERYVQRSVANNLNDIGKDHPVLVIETCRRWLRGAGPGRKYIVSHGLRSLVKAGDPAALAVLGAGAKARVRIEAVALEPARVRIGGKARIRFTLTSTAKTSQDLVVDYAVFFVKRGGDARPKVFKLRRVTLLPRASVSLRATVSFAVHSTRKPIPGRHAFEARVNGAAFPLGALEVVAAARAGARR